jgi:membrane protease YdiL (CAAX protease family)
MTAPIADSQADKRLRTLPTILLASTGLFAFCVLFLVIDQTYFRFISPRFPSVGTSSWLATAWGIASRAPWILFISVIVLLRPRLFALRPGEMFLRWRLVLSIILLNCLVVAAFLLLAGDTPYSGNQWLITEIVTVPVVEELLWRGLVFSLLVSVLHGRLGNGPALRLTICLSGLAFGLLHAGNALAGVPPEFVAIQTLNAVIWGVVYGYVRAKTDSVYPSLLSHAAMNLVVVAI